MPARTPIVVVGSGIAGLCTALAAAPRPVVLLSRMARGTDSASVLAQGGIAAAIGPGDSVESHVADTLVAGCGLNDVSRVRMLAAAAPAAIEWLQEQGVAFDHAEGTLKLGREGGHRFARIVHAGGDASGARISAALSAAVAVAAHVEWRSGVDVDALLMQGNRVSGVRINAGGHAESIPASAVVLATGGIGALFAHTTNPGGADGSGLALAMAAGAEVRDLEFVQFHPTALDLDRHSLPLITEALRGAGARLLDPNLPPRLVRSLPHRPAFVDTLTWLEIGGAAPDVIAGWKEARQHRGPAPEAAPGDDADAPTGPAGPRKRRRRRRRRGRKPGPPAAGD